MTLTATQTPPHGLVAAHLICMASMMIWALGLPANGLLLPILPPLTLSAMRLVMASAVLLPFWLWREGLGAARAANWWLGAGVGSLIGFGGLTVVLAQARTDAVTVAVISAVLPVVGLGVEMVLDGRKLTGAAVVGIALALAGGVVALGPSIHGVSFGIGALICLLSVLLYALGSRMSVTSFPALTPLGRTSVTLGGAAVVMVLFTLVAQGTGLVPTPDLSLMGPREWGALFLFSVGSLAISQVLWLMSVERLGIGTAAFHINATPFYVMIFGLGFGGVWNWWQALGAALVACGVIISQGLPRAR